MFETFSLGEDPKLIGETTNVTNNTTDIEEEGSAQLLAALERGARLPCPPTCPQVIYVKLIYPCWHLHSHQRPDFSTICSEIRDLMNQY